MIALGASLMLGCGPTPRPLGESDAASLSAADYKADFDQLVNELAEGYAYTDDKRIDWEALRLRLGPRVLQVHDRSAFVPLLEEVLDELHDAHANLGTNTAHSFRLVPTGADIWAELVEGRALITEVRPGSAAMDAGLRAGQEIVAISGVPVAQAIDARLGSSGGADPTARGWALRSLLAGRHDEPRKLAIATAEGAKVIAIADKEPQDAPLEAKRLAGGVGYINVHNHLGDDALVDAFDTALAELSGCPALILDLRDTPSGGNTGVAEAILGRFVREAKAYQRYELPNAGWKGRSRLWDQFVAPRGPFTYEGRLAVLVDHWTGSMGEGMAIGVDAMGRGAVVGTRMAGLNGAVYSSTLEKTGIRFSYPAERLFHPHGEPRHSWTAPWLVDLRGNDGNGRDAILERAMSLLATPQ